MSKKLLLDARKSIEAKDFENCLNLCQQILQEEKNNYAAICYSGLAYQKLGQLDKSQKAYEQGTIIQPESALAWQGLVELFKVTTQWKKIKEVVLACYPKFVPTGHAKFVEYVSLLAVACENLGELEPANNYWKQILEQLQKEETNENKIQISQKKFEVLIKKQSTLKKMEENEITKTWKVTASIEELSNPSAMLIGKAKTKRSLSKTLFSPKNELTSLYSKLFESVSLISKETPFPEDFMKIIKDQINREISLTTVDERVGVLKFLLSVIDKEGVRAGYFIYETFFQLILENENSFYEVYLNLVEKVCCYFPHRPFIWIHFVRKMLPEIEAREYTSRIPLKNLKCLSEIQSDFTALKNMSNENDGSFSVNLQHSFLILCSECETRIQLLLGNYETVIEKAQEGLKHIENARKPHLFADGGFKEVFLRFKHCIALSYRHLSNTQKSQNTYLEIIKINPKYIEAIRGLIDISFEQEKFDLTQKYVTELLQLRPNDPWANSYQAWFDYLIISDHHKKEDYDTDQKLKLLKSRDRMLSAINGVPWFCNANYWLGRIYWTMNGDSRKSPEKAYQSFLDGSKTSDEMSPRTPLVSMSTSEEGEEEKRKKRKKQKKIGKEEKRKKREKQKKRRKKKEAKN